MNNNTINIKTFVRLEAIVHIDGKLQKCTTQDTVFVEPSCLRRGMIHVQLEDDSIHAVQLSDLFIPYGELALREDLSIRVEDSKLPEPAKYTKTMEDVVNGKPATPAPEIERNINGRAIPQSEVNYLIEQFTTEELFRDALARVFKGVIPAAKFNDLFNMIMNMRDFSPIMNLTNMEIRGCLIGLFKLYTHKPDLDITKSAILHAYILGKTVL